MTENVFRDIDILLLVARCDIVDLSARSVLQDFMNGTAIVLHEDPVPDVLSSPVDREGPTSQCVSNESRDEFLRMLIRPVVVRASCHCDFHTICDVICVDQKISGSLACRVWTGRIECIHLGERSFVTTAVDFVCADLLELDMALATRLKKGMCSENVRFNEYRWSLDAAVYMGFSRKIHYGINLLDQRRHELPIQNVAFDELVSFLAAQVSNVHQVPGIGQSIEIDHTATGLLHQVADEVATNETCSAGNENPIHVSHFGRPIYQVCCFCCDRCG